MRAKLYRGEHNDRDRAAGYRFYYEYFNMDVDPCKLKLLDERGNELVYIRTEFIKGDIVCWNPFKVISGTTEYQFTCPKCGSHHATRIDPYFSDPFFFQGYYKCGECGLDKIDEKPLVYYSDCFTRKKPNKPLALF